MLFFISLKIPLRVSYLQLSSPIVFSKFYLRYVFIFDTFKNAFPCHSTKRYNLQAYIYSTEIICTSFTTDEQSGS